MKNSKITPIGLKGREINERMKELMGIKPINENKSTSAVELTKIGPDGNAYAIVRENREWYIKKADKTTGLVAEDFKYIGGLQNKKMEAYPSYSSALKRLNFKFKSLAEAHNFTGEINIVENDNLISEAGFAGFSQHGGNGFMGEINMSRYSEPIEEEGEEGHKDNDLIDYIVPSWSMAGLINGDFSGLSDEEIKKLEAFIESVTNENGNAVFLIDDIEGKDNLGFKHRNDIDDLGGDVYRVYIKPNNDIELSEAEQAIEEMIAREELYGNQHKLDVDKDGEIEASDLAMLRNKKSMDEMNKPWSINMNMGDDIVNHDLPEEDPLEPSDMDEIGDFEAVVLFQGEPVELGDNHGDLNKFAPLDKVEIIYKGEPILVNRRALQITESEVKKKV